MIRNVHLTFDERGRSAVYVARTPASMTAAIVSADPGTGGLCCDGRLYGGCKKFEVSLLGLLAKIKV